jgi:cathepsin L
MYHSEERSLRKSVFEQKLKGIIAHNKDSTKTWKQGVNHLTDRTEQELKAMRGGFPSHKQRLHPNYRSVSSAQLRELEDRQVDWRDKNVVTAVKDQGNCGSCWSFASAEVVESYYALLTGQLSALSQQQILDCTPNPNSCGGTGGCGGGTAELAFARIMQLGGLSTEWTYPYVSYSGSSQKCRFGANTPPFANISAYFTLPQNEYAPLLEHVANKGPIAISVDASAWSSYESGVFDGCNQTDPDLDHAVMLVGYGVDATSNLPYWLVRNSWSSKWGEAGYIRLLRQNDQARCGEDLTPRDGDGCKDSPPEVKVCGVCGILYDNAYPVVSVPKF